MGRGADESLARAAVAGDSAAFAELYDRHERRAFNLAYRITGTREDAADATQEAFLKVLARLPRLAGRKLDFGNYLLTAVRHASYDVLAAAGRADPTDDVPDSAHPVGCVAAPPPEEDPGRSVLLAAQQEEIRAANASLPPRQRAVLALRELEGLSYDEIAAEMGMNRNSVAQLISRARIGLRDALRRTALLSIVPATAACERALALVAMRDDGEPVPKAWLDNHLAECETCGIAREAMAEAGASYRAWAPVTALEVLRRDTIARAGDRLGHDWGQLPVAGVRWAPRAPNPSRPSRPLRARLRRDAFAASAVGVLMLLVLLAAHAQDGVVEADVEPAPAPALRTSSPAVAAPRAQTTHTVTAHAVQAAPAPAASPVDRPQAPAKPAAKAERREAIVVRRGPAAAVAPPAVAPPPPAPVEDRADDEAVTPQPQPEQPPLPPPPPPPPPASSAVTNFVAQPPPPPPPPSTRPQRSPDRPSGGSSGVPVP